MEAEICRTFGLSCFLASFPKELVSARGGAPALPRYFATILAFLTAPVIGWLTLCAVTSPTMPAEHRPGRAMLGLSWLGLLLLGGTGIVWVLLV